MFAVFLLAVAIYQAQQGASPRIVSLLLALLVLVLVLRAPLLREAKPNPLGVLGIALSFSAPLFYEWSTIKVPPIWIGILFVAAGLFYLAVIAWAYLALNRSIAIFPSYRPVVVSGPYEFVRHPVYSSYLHLTLCYVALAPTPGNLIVTAAFAAGLLIRMRVEESLLAASHEYLPYRTRVRSRIIHPLISAPAVVALLVRSLSLW